MCTIDESMLTGESIPFLKQALECNENIYSAQGSGRNSTIFSGTLCLETRYHLKGKVPVLGLVT